MLTSEFQLIDNEGNVIAKKQVLGHLQGNTRKKAYIPKRQLILLSAPTVKGTF
ncbi:hypothetical protein SAMN04487928_109134 [Butyrivibrio proteoclasticus]|uniref:Uncharacterized protein n=1 Tax=Butyrivibrio proteoclasticus TaxID=43305 RepID=A0A1I5TQ63_9FIRM|nr:hypothetical protein SAMN04487928_109134 [Butyrivibrio proteoclasticus]